MGNPVAYGLEDSEAAAAFISIAVDRVDDLYADLAARGVEVLIEPSTREYGLREFVIQTPDGHRIMFAESVVGKASHR